jgi:hypothetical protein
MGVVKMLLSKYLTFRVNQAGVMPKQFTPKTSGSYLWSTLSVISFVGLSLYGSESFAAPDGMLRELQGLTDMSVSANKTVSWIAGGAALSLGSIWALVKQNIMVFGSAVLIAVAAFKGSALVTAACLI